MIWAVVWSGVWRGQSGCDETSVCQDVASGWLVGDKGDVEDSEVSLACTVRELEKPFAENPGRDAGLGSAECSVVWRRQSWRTGLCVSHTDSAGNVERSGHAGM